MNRMVMLLISLGIIVSVVGAFPPNPCPQQGVWKGNTTHYRCVDRDYICELPRWNYLDLRTCEYWCCYNGVGLFTLAMVSGCTPWSENIDCCTSQGEWFTEPPGGWCQ